MTSTSCVWLVYSGSSTRTSEINSFLLLPDSRMLSRHRLKVVRDGISVQTFSRYVIVKLSTLVLSLKFESMSGRELSSLPHNIQIGTSSVCVLWPSCHQWWHVAIHPPCCSPSRTTLQNSYRVRLSWFPFVTRRVHWVDQEHFPRLQSPARDQWMAYGRSLFRRPWTKSLVEERSPESRMIPVFHNPSRSFPCQYP